MQAWKRTGGWSKEQSQTERLPRLDAWRKYVFEVVSRYKDKFQYWEVMNEPTAWMNADDYFPFLKAAHEEAKRAAPRSKVIAGDTGWKGGPFFQQIQATPCFTWTEILSILRQQVLARGSHLTTCAGPE